MKILYAFNILLFATLFFAGIHLNEEEKAFCAGLRPQGDNYEWASSAFAIWGLLCTCVSIFLAYKTFLESRIAAGGLFFISLGAFIYAIMILLKSESVSMKETLVVFGPYIVLGMLINIYVFLNCKIDDHPG